MFRKKRTSDSATETFGVVDDWSNSCCYIIFHSDSNSSGQGSSASVFASVKEPELFAQETRDLNRVRIIALIRTLNRSREGCFRTNFSGNFLLTVLLPTPSWDVRDCHDILHHPHTRFEITLADHLAFRLPFSLVSAQTTIAAHTFSLPLDLFQTVCHDRRPNCGLNSGSCERDAGAFNQLVFINLRACCDRQNVSIVIVMVRSLFSAQVQFLVSLNILCFFCASNILLYPALMSTEFKPISNAIVEI